MDKILLCAAYKLSIIQHTICVLWAVRCYWFALAVIWYWFVLSFKIILCIVSSIVNHAFCTFAFDHEAMPQYILYFHSMADVRYRTKK